MKNGIPRDSLTISRRTPGPNRKAPALRSSSLRSRERATSSLIGRRRICPSASWRGTEPWSWISMRTSWAVPTSTNLALSNSLSWIAKPPLSPT